MIYEIIMSALHNIEIHYRLTLNYQIQMGQRQIINAS